MNNKNTEEKVSSNSESEKEHLTFTDRLPNCMQSIINFAKGEGVHLVVLVILFFVSVRLLTQFGGSLANKFFASLEVDYRLLPKTENEEILNFRDAEEARLKNYARNMQGSEFAKQRLVEQTKEIQGRVRSHVQVTKYFYVQYFVSVTTATVSAVIAAICLFSISKSGWSNTKNSLLSLFVVSFGFATIFSAYIVVFKYEENISQNKTLYLAYAALEDRVSSYFATGQFLINSAQGERTAITNSSQVIQFIDDELATINNIAIGFDATKIPNYQDYQNLGDGTSSNDAP
ncbi:hypothetical protein [Trichocoleus sp. FACHB-262]|uniref:hypothetical protein n=1 Tax=Trichocoleus sp. FACHB-262 TaxID=2692869 RepID=UPI001684ACD7|nr:hypothetical protein [Trichocoleus sp. FACHB-262]MBD2119320.1 hypothetical protein [Trichocoleus sp. FACHB-262]